MSFQYLLDESARKDYDIAVEWYLSKSLKTTNNFVLEV